MVKQVKIDYELMDHRFNGGSITTYEDHKLVQEVFYGNPEEFREALQEHTG